MADRNRGDWSVPFAIALIVIGLWLLADRVLGPLWAPFEYFVRLVGRAAWPLALIAIGVLLLISVRRGGLQSASGRRLYRSRDERVVAGVLGGLGEYLGISVTLIRVAFVIFGFASGFGAVLLYIAGVILIPEEPLGGEPQQVQWPGTSGGSWGAPGQETVQTPPPAPPAPPVPPSDVPGQPPADR